MGYQSELQIMPRGRGRGARGARGRGCGSPVSDAESESGDATPTVSSLYSHPLGIIISSISPPKGIRFTINKSYFKEAENFADLPDRLLGEIERWVKRDEGRAMVIWPADQSNTIEFLQNLFDPSLAMKLEPYEDGRSAPKPKGSTAKRLYAKGTTLGMAFVDAYYLYLYMNKISPKDFPFKSAMRRMAFALMHNNLDAIDQGEINPDELFTVPLSSGQQDSASHAAGEDALDDDGLDDQVAHVHQAIPLRQIPGYMGARQQWCAICLKAKVTYACAACSNKDLILPVHPLKKHANQKEAETCLHEHRRNPQAHKKVAVRHLLRDEATGGTDQQPRRFRPRAPAL